MDDTVPFGSRWYLAMLALLVFARGMDFLSTYIATPNLVLEGNPIAKKLGWKWGLPLNVALCLGSRCGRSRPWWPPRRACWWPRAISSLLAYALARRVYRRWYVARIRGTRVRLFLFCLAGNTLLTAAVGAALIFFSHLQLVPLAIGMGIVAYAVAVLVHPAGDFPGSPRAQTREARALAAAQSQPVDAAARLAAVDE